MNGKQQHQMVCRGLVSLVGAGPGDPELLTLKAWKAIESASVIVYDNLVSDAIRDLFPARAKQIYAGKVKGCHRYCQEEINQLIAGYAKQGEQVCRLKGGDGFIFGRGGEEMLSLARQGIRVSVIPGITAASGCSAATHIPLTHRGLAQGCTFITAHAGKTLDLNWTALASLNQTLVVYMGLTKAGLIQHELIQAGMSPNTPVAVIEKGCTPQQRALTATLHELSELVLRHQVKSPALIVIGEVVQVAEQMDWLMQDHRVSEPETDVRHTA